MSPIRYFELLLYYIIIAVSDIALIAKAMSLNRYCLVTMLTSWHCFVASQVDHIEVTTEAAHHRAQQGLAQVQKASEYQPGCSIS
jgi:hypothetical protein